MSQLPVTFTPTVASSRTPTTEHRGQEVQLVIKSHLINLNNLCNIKSIDLCNVTHSSSNVPPCCTKCFYELKDHSKWCLCGCVLSTPQLINFLYWSVLHFFVGRMISTGKLFVSDSLLDELGDRKQVCLPERFCLFTHTEKKFLTVWNLACTTFCCLCHDYSIYCLYFRFNVSPSEISRNVESLKDPHQDECFLLKESQISPRQEAFLKLTPDQMKPESNNNGSISINP